MAHLFSYGDYGSRVALRSGKVMYVEKHDKILDHSNGSADAPDIPLVFIHGFQNTIKTWIPLLPHLQQYTRIVYDVDPHGLTGPSGGPLNMRAHARDTADILHHFSYDNDPVVLIGHSAGTLIAMQFAHDFPDRVRKLILLGPLMLPVLPFVKEAARTGIVRSAPFEELLAIHTSWLCKRLKDDPDLHALIEDEMRSHEKHREALQIYFEGIAEFEFPGVHGVETWVVKELQDTAVPEGAAEAVRDLTNATMFEIDTGHYFTWEDLDGTLNVLKTALTSGVSLV